MRIHSSDGQNFESDINQPENIGILVKIIRYMVSSFSLHPIKVHAQHCHSTFFDMNAKACPQIWYCTTLKYWLNYELYRQSAILLMRKIKNYVEQIFFNNIYIPFSYSPSFVVI